MNLVQDLERYNTKEELEIMQFSPSGMAHHLHGTALSAGGNLTLTMEDMLPLVREHMGNPEPRVARDFGGQILACLASKMGPGLAREEHDDRNLVLVEGHMPAWIDTIATRLV